MRPHHSIQPIFHPIHLVQPYGAGKGAAGTSLLTKAWSLAINIPSGCTGIGAGAGAGAGAIIGCLPRGKARACAYAPGLCGSGIFPEWYRQVSA